jgi:transcriptional regulator with XRE-family HTH domain
MSEFVLNTDQEFGARLRAERERLGLQVHELAHLAGRPEGTQQHYEAGSKPIPVDYLQALHVRSDLDVMFVVTGHRVGSVDRP